MALVVTLLLGGVSACSGGFGNECPEGTVQSDSDTRVECVPLSDDMQATSQADSGAVPDSEEAFDDCRNAGNSEEYCLGQGYTP